MVRMTSHGGKSRKATRKTKSTKEQNVKSLKFFKPTLATTLAIVVAWLLSVQPAQAGYTVTLQQVGPDVVATGSGPIDLTGLTFLKSSIFAYPVLFPPIFSPPHILVFRGFADLRMGPASSKVYL